MLGVVRHDRRLLRTREATVTSGRALGWLAANMDTRAADTEVARGMRLVEGWGVVKWLREHLREWPARATLDGATRTARLSHPSASFPGCWRPPHSSGQRHGYPYRPKYRHRTRLQ